MKEPTNVPPEPLGEKKQKTKNESSPKKTSKIDQKNMRVFKIFVMDGSELEISIDKNANGKDLFDKVAQMINLLEKDYFGLSFLDSGRTKTWLQVDKKLVNQLKKLPFELTFEVKFYPPDPDLLQEDITRYYLCSQVRDDVVLGKLACSPLTQALLGSYFIQAHLGDYDPEQQGGPAEQYLSEFKFGPQNSLDVLAKVHELHKAHKGQTPSEAELHYLQNAKKLALYGIELRAAKDSDNLDIGIAVCSSGILVYRGLLRINRIAWPKIIKISYRMNHFYVKVRPGEFEQRETVLSFKFPSSKAAKAFWKQCVEHHAFFRLMSFEPAQKHNTFGLGSSKFRFSGRTLYQSKLASGLIHRPEPNIQRSVSSRFPVRPAALEVLPADQKRFSEYKPAELSSPLKFADAVSKQPTREHSATLLSQATSAAASVAGRALDAHILRHEKSPDDLMPFEVAVRIMTPVHAPQSEPHRHQEVYPTTSTPHDTSMTSHSSGDTSATSRVTNDERDLIPLEVQQHDRNVEIPISQHEKSEKGHKDHKKQDKKQKQFDEPMLPDFVTEKLTDFYPLKQIPIAVEREVFANIERTRTPAEPIKKIVSDQDKTFPINSPTPGTTVCGGKLYLERSGLEDGNFLPPQQNGIPHQNGFGEHRHHSSRTPPSVSPKPVCTPPKSSTTVCTKEESVHDVPAQIMTVKGADGSFTTTTTAGQVKTVKQTIQTKSFETFSVPASAIMMDSHSSPISRNEIVHEVTRVTKSGQPPPPVEIPEDARIIDVQRQTDGNRTIETITYEIERDGVLETRTEHRVTVVSNSDIDYEQELSAAILEATKMNPKLTVEKVEIRRTEA